MLTHGELFAGISGFGVGFESAGIVTKWRVEIDNAARSVLRKRYPNDVLMRDVRECGRHNLEPVDIISFGSPCQDLSVAGKRAGLDGARSGLFFEAIRIVSELRPTLGIWENVPGAFTSNSGRDFLAVLRAFHDIGARDIAWRVVDAQYDGVAQRRNRVFVAADFGGERAGQILFECACMCGHPAPSREAGKGVAHSVTASPGGCSGKEQQTTFVGPGGGLNELGAYPLNDTGGGSALHSGAGRNRTMNSDSAGEPMTPIGLDIFNGIITGDVACTLTTNTNTGGGGTGPTIGFHGRQDPISELETSMPLEAKAGQCVGFLPSQGSDAGTVGAQKEQSPTLRANGRASCPAVAHTGTMSVRRLTPRECERLQGFPDDWTRWGIDEKGREYELKDGPRYKMLGNAVATVSAAWLGRQIAAAMKGLTCHR